MKKPLNPQKLLIIALAFAIGLLITLPANADDVLPGIDLFTTQADHTWDSTFVF